VHTEHWMQSMKPRFEIGIIVEADGDAFYAHCPALPGLHVDGETEQEAIDNAKDAVIAYLQSMVKHGDPVPLACYHADQRRAEQRTIQVEPVFA